MHSTPLTAGHVDAVSTVREYLSRADWRVQANANQGYSLGGMILNMAGKLSAEYWLNAVFSPDAAQAHRHGDLHIHDLDMLSGYCAGWSLRTLLQLGFSGVGGKVESTPPGATCPAPAARSSTFLARCKTSGPARRRSARSIPTWHRSSARTG